MQKNQVMGMFQRNPLLDSVKTQNPNGSRTKCPKAVKETVWRSHNGNKMQGKCYVCKVSVSYTNFEVGHNKARANGGKYSVANCRPICRSCNRSMGKMSIEKFKEKYFSKGGKKKTVRKRAKKKKLEQSTRGLIEPINFPQIKF